MLPVQPGVNVEDELKRLLDAEARAEDIARKADTQREAMIEAAMAEAREAEARFEARIPSIRAGFMDKAGAQAEQTLKALKRRHEERHNELRTQAMAREDEAVEAALALLIDPQR